MSETLVTNSTISHYRITKKIGAGGMGEVYRARDERPGRQLAKHAVSHIASAGDSCNQRCPKLDAEKR
jgi:serine/threonine protein kinase